MPDTDLFLGTWELIPELSLYASGHAPSRGTYVITQPEVGRVAFHVTWRMAGDDEDRATQFGGPSDGSTIPLPAAPNAPDAFTIARVDSRTLDSAALRAAEVVAYARRVVSEDGTLMAVVQENTLPEGGRHRNFQVYRRAATV